MPRLHRYVGEFSGAFADLGTFLPIVLGVLTLQHIDPSGLFIGFGFFALFTALIYRRPVPVQPMKVVAAIVITTHLDAATVAATGVLLGLVLLLLAALGVINGIANKIPRTVLSGIQLGLGLTLAWAGFQLIMDEWMIGIIAFLLLIILQQTRLKSFTVLLVVIGISCWSIISGDHALPQIKLDIYLPSLISFGWDDIQTSALILLLPQLALTLTNAVVVTAAIAADLFPSDADRISPNRLAITTGALNFCLAPIGAFPMCHGAGGLVVQHRFGARSGLAPAIFGITCLSLGLFMGPDAMKLLSLLPLAALGALLMLAGLQLAKSQSLFQANGWELFVLATTGVSCVIINVAAGLLIGLLMEMMRNRIRKT